MHGTIQIADRVAARISTDDGADGIPVRVKKVAAEKRACVV